MQGGGKGSGIVLLAAALAMPLSARAQAADDAFSSAAHHLGRRRDPLVAPASANPAYWQLGNTPFEREGRYAALLDRGATDEVAEVVLNAALKGWVLGSDSFVQGLQQRTQRRLARQKAGRPSATASEKAE